MNFPTTAAFPPYTPSNWYWNVGQSTTQVWSSARAQYVPLTDTTYVAWLAAGNVPTPIADIASLQIVLAAAYPAGAPATTASLHAYANAKAATLLSNTRSYSAGGPTLKSDATGPTLADLLALLNWGEANPTASTNWVANDSTVTAFTGAQIAAVAPLVGAYAQTIYSAELATVLAEIAAATVTTTAQIDAYAWRV